ncbi:murein hydrolase transporter LrgA, partial [Staphylococcus shinii]
NIRFLLLPASVLVINSLSILSTISILIIVFIIISTLLLLLCTGFFAQMLITKSFIPRKRPQKQLAEDKL